MSDEFLAKIAERVAYELIIVRTHVWSEEMNINFTYDINQLVSNLSTILNISPPLVRTAFQHHFGFTIESWISEELNQFVPEYDSLKDHTLRKYFFKSEVLETSKSNWEKFVEMVESAKKEL